MDFWIFKFNLNVKLNVKPMQLVWPMTLWLTKAHQLADFLEQMHHEVELDLQVDDIVYVLWIDESGSV